MDQQFLSWAIFIFVISTLLLFDLGVFNKKNTAISFKKSLYLSCFYILVACLFGVYVYYELGSTSANEYFTGYILEKIMSLDNIFVISIIFKFFKIPSKYQHRVLFLGILGVIILRAIMIFIGASLLANFEWILFIFAALLITTGLKTLTVADHSTINIEDMYIYKLLKNVLNISPKCHGDNFIIKDKGKYFVTPLFMALITIETMDVIFALDSIPAIFAVTQNTYIIYTSNVFAILGLRALFFVLENIVERFKFIKYSLAIILILIGIKIFVAHFITIPTYITLVTTIALISLGIIVSVLKKDNNN